VPVVAATSLADRLAKVLPEIYAITPLEEFPRRMLPLILGIVGGDKSCYHVVEVATGDLRVIAMPHHEALDELDEARVAYMHQHPLLAHFTRCDRLEGRMISDFLSISEYHSLPLYGEFFRHLDVEDQLLVGVSLASSGYLAGFSVERGYPGFAPEDRHIFDALQPHLATTYANARCYSRALRSVVPALQDPARRLHRLTTRQFQILESLATGRSNIQIAAALDLSPGTVRKHLEHILRRLEVTTRTAAAVAFVAGSRQGREEWWTASVPSLVNLP
jgi:DNA-binding CsgD family transcriptional regulator